MAADDKVCITADGLNDLPEEFLRLLNIPVCPFYVLTDNGRFLDRIEVNSESIADYMVDKEAFVQSVEPTVEDYKKFFKEVQEKHSIVFHISIASPESGCFESAREAAKDFSQITVFNSMQISSGLGLIILVSCILARDGLSPDEIEERLSHFAPHVSTSFIITDAAYLYRANRLSAGWQTICNRFLIRPIFAMKNGKIKASKVSFGRFENVMKKYIKWSLKHRFIDSEVLFITHSGLSNEFLENIKKEAEKYIHFKHVFAVETSAAITCTIGPGSMGLIFSKKGRDSIMLEPMLTYLDESSSVKYQHKQLED